MMDDGVFAVDRLYWAGFNGEDISDEADRRRALACRFRTYGELSRRRMNYKPLGHDVRHPFGCWCYRCIRKEVARLQGEWDRMQKAHAALRERLRLNGVQEPKMEESE